MVNKFGWMITNMAKTMNNLEAVYPEKVQVIIDKYEKVLKEIPEDWTNTRKVLMDNLTKLYQTSVPTYVQKLNISDIPHGHYCYEPLSVDPNGKMKIKKCPFHTIDNNHEHQNNGFCNYLNAGDWMDDGTLDLWDSIKNCEINLEENHAT
jgi:hypothetical protein